MITEDNLVKLLSERFGEDVKVATIRGVSRTTKPGQTTASYSTRFSKEILKLLKPYNYTNNRYKNNVNNYNKNNSLPPATEKPTIEYKGKTYKEHGREGYWNEFIADDGDMIRKHSFKNIIEEKKTSKNRFNAAAEKIIYAATGT
jgi:hypothetical protein